MINSLNQKFGCSKVKFFEGSGGLRFVSIANDHATAEICLHGAHITSFKPHDKQPMIWVSDDSIYQEGTPIRGGIPVCWPWFGAHPEDKTKPSHGFVRNRYWDVKSVHESEGETVLTFSITDDENSRKVWDYSFEVNLTVKVSDKLEIELKTHNTDEKALTVGGALHSYFPVSNISDISIKGLCQRIYVDALQQMQKFTQDDGIVFDKEVDRVYLDSPDTCKIDDPAFAEKICIAKKGSNSTVVWNPWIDKSVELSGFANDDFKEMVCVETTNALDDVYTIEPGETHSLCATIYLTDK